MSDGELRAMLMGGNKKRKIVRCFELVFLLLTIVLLVLRKWYAAVPCGLAALVFLLCSGMIRQRATKLIKANIVGDALTQVFEVEQYDHDRHLDEALLRDTKLIPKWDECGGGDFVRGKYRGVPFLFSDVRLIDISTQRDSSGRSSRKRETVFHGQWLACEIRKNIEFPLLVRERGKRLLGNDSSKSDVETENAAFNAQFQILTEDPHIAFYILSPHFMEHIVRMDTAAQARTNLFFGGGWAHIAVHNGRDSFELGKEAGDITALRKRVKGEVSYITGIIDELLRNEYLFGEENQ